VIIVSDLRYTHSKKEAFDDILSVGGGKNCTLSAIIVILSRAISNGTGSLDMDFKKETTAVLLRAVIFV
jgi:hypothetical protein